MRDETVTISTLDKAIAGALEEYNADEKGGGNRFAFTGDADPRAVSGVLAGPA